MHIHPLFDTCWPSVLHKQAKHGLWTRCTEFHLQVCAVLCCGMLSGATHTSRPYLAWPGTAVLCKLVGSGTALLRLLVVACGLGSGVIFFEKSRIRLSIEESVLTIPAD